MSDLLSVPEFAEAAGKKKQGIYEQVKNENSKLYPFVVFQGEKAFIKAVALKEVYGIVAQSQDNQDDSQEKQAENQDSQGNSQVVNQDFQAQSQDNQGESQAQSQDDTPQGQSIIAFFQAQLEEKDRQIARLQEQTKQQAEENKKKDEVIQEQLAKLNELLRNSQTLQAQSNALLLGGRQEVEQEEAPQGDFITIEHTEQEQPQEPTKKRSWLYRLFFGED